MKTISIQIDDNFLIHDSTGKSTGVYLPNVNYHFEDGNDRLHQIIELKKAGFKLKEIIELDNKGMLL